MNKFPHDFTICPNKAMAQCSIILPVLNEGRSIAHYLTELQHLRGQAELILVDGGSADDTLKLAEPFVDKLISAPQGRAVQMNVGAQQAKGEVLLFLHADTILPPNTLGLISQVMDSQRQWGRFDVKLSGSHPMLFIIAFFMNWRSRLTGIATGDQAIFISRPLFDAIGHFPEIALMEDIALSKKLNKICPPVCLKAKVTSSGRRWEQNGVLKTVLLMWNLRLRYFFGADPKELARLYAKG